MAASETVADWARSTSMPEFAQHWFGESLTYPVARGQERPVRGWVCSGCGAGYAPWVASCGHCAPKADAPAFIAKSADEITDDEYER